MDRSRRGGAHGLLSTDVRFLSELVAHRRRRRAHARSPRDLLADGRRRFVAARRRRSATRSPTPRCALERARQAAARWADRADRVGQRQPHATSTSSSPSASPSTSPPWPRSSTAGCPPPSHRWRPAPLRRARRGGGGALGPTSPRAGPGDRSRPSTRGRARRAALAPRRRPRVGGGDPRSTSRSSTTAAASGSAPRPRPDWADIGRGRLRRPHSPPLLRRSLDDLAALLLADATRPADTFAAAGSPWFMTLFGRDSHLGRRIAAAARHRARRRDAAHPRPPPGPRGRPGDRRASRARSCTRCARPARPSGRYAPAALLRHRRRHAAVDQPAPRRVALGPGRRPRSPSCCRTARAALLGWVLGRRRRRRVPRLP